MICGTMKMNIHIYIKNSFICKQLYIDLLIVIGKVEGHWSARININMVSKKFCYYELIQTIRENKMCMVKTFKYKLNKITFILSEALLRQHVSRQISRSKVLTVL